MGKLIVPGNLSPDLQKLFHQIDEEISRLAGSRNVDWHGRRIMNAGSAVNDGDYVTLLDVKKLIGVTAKKRGIIGALRGAGGGVGEGTLAGCAERTESVELYDGGDIVAGYCGAHPDELADSCTKYGGGSWTFMDGLVAELQAADERFGYNGKRGNPGDLSGDAVSYYCGPLGSQEVGSKDCYVIDVIESWCGPEEGARAPGPTWNNVSKYACGAWVPSRE
jgi:hypothetical protein